MFYEVSFLVCSSLSVISTGILLFHFAYYKQLRTYAFKLAFPVFLFDFILSLDYFCPLVYYFLSESPAINDSLCRLQAFLKLFATNGTFCSTLSISWTLYTFFIRNKPIKTQNVIKYFGPFTVLLPLCIAIIPFITDNYKNTSPLPEVMCFLVVKNSNTNSGETDLAGIILKILLSFVPFLLTVLLEIYFILTIFYDFWKKRDDRYSTDIKNLILYPLFLLLSWIWIMTERFYELVTNGEQIQWLNAFDLQITVFNGFVNSMIYGYLSINPFSRCCSENPDDYQDNNKFKEIEPQSDFDSDDWSVLKSEIKLRHKKESRTSSVDSYYDQMLPDENRQKTQVTNQ